MLSVGDLLAAAARTAGDVATELRVGRVAADAALQKFVDKHASQGPFQVACIYALRKQPDEMFTWLERAYAENDPGMTQLLTAPFIHNYRSDPRFAALCQKLNLPVPRPDEEKL